MKGKLDLNRLGDLRKRQGLNQYDFWTPLGITQSGGSRYENGPVQGANERRLRNGRRVPKPVALLLQLRHSGRITNDDLAGAAKALGWLTGKASGGK